MCLSPKVNMKLNTLLNFKYPELKFKKETLVNKSKKMSLTIKAAWIGVAAMVIIATAQIFFQNELGVNQKVINGNNTEFNSETIINADSGSRINIFNAETIVNTDKVLIHDTIKLGNSQ